MTITTRYSEHPIKAQIEQLERYLRWSAEAVEATGYDQFVDVSELDKCSKAIRDAREALNIAKQHKLIAAHINEA